MNEMLKKGGSFIGTMLGEISFPNISYIYRKYGLDFFIIDCEHGALDYSQVSNIISVARLAGIQAIVRIPEVRRECIIKYLDMGADGLLIPMIHNAQDVRRVVDFAKYPPLGNRGISINRAHSCYDPGDVGSYLHKANAHTMLFPQIELRDALEDLENIASVPGIDGLIVGPSDLSMDLGVFNQLSHPLLRDAVRKVAKSSLQHGLQSGIITSDRSLIAVCVESGMSMICSGSDTRHLCKGLAADVADIRKLTGKE